MADGRDLVASGESFGQSSRRRQTVDQLDQMGDQSLAEAAHYLIVSTALGLLGYFAAVAPLIMRIGWDLGVETSKEKLVKIPTTIASLVSEWEAVEARVFFGFELASAMCLLLSCYPFLLRNACCNPLDDGCRLFPRRVCKKFSMTFATWRWFSVPLGLLLEACIPTVPAEERGMQTIVLAATHHSATFLMMFGFLTSEMHALSSFGFRCTKGTVQPGTNEFRWRLLSLHLSTWSWLSFFIVVVVRHVWKTTLGAWRVGRAISFILNVAGGFFMLINQFFIWYYCDERNIDFTRSRRSTRGGTPHSARNLELQRAAWLAGPVAENGPSPSAGPVAEDGPSPSAVPSGVPAGALGQEEE